METKFISLNSGMNRITSPEQRHPVEGDVAAAKASSTTGPRAVAPTPKAEESNAVGSDLRDDDLQEVVDNLNQMIEPTNRALRFSVDQHLGRPIVSVVDKDTDEVIRQIPSEVALQVADALDEVTGALVSERA